VGVLQFIDDEDDTKVGIRGDKSLAEAGCRFCGACVEACPAEIDVPRYVRLIA
jgi:ferredoxin